MKNSFKNTFPTDTKISFHQQEYLKNEKNLLPIARKSVSTSRNKVSFKKVDTLNFKNFSKALNKRILFPLDRKSVFASRNEEFVKIYLST